MRSYYAHLQTALSAQTPSAIAPRPTLRSSAIFPVLQRKGISSRILFMGYWILKRHIKEIAAIVSLRTQNGTLIARRHFTINEAKTYRLELSEFLEMANAHEEEFTGTLEIEFFSTQNLFFPFPAVVINYYGPKFSSVVHTAQRVYNDEEDMIRNTQTNVAESGFNLYADEDREPFIALINGSQSVKDSLLKMTFINKDQEILERDLSLGDLQPYELKMIHPGQLMNLVDFLKGEVGTGKIQFAINWAFPRVIVGNMHRQHQALTITHTFYDCSQANSESDYWVNEEKGWHPATLMVPVALSEGCFTNVYFYPIYSPTAFSVTIEIYDQQGTRLGIKDHAAIILSPRMEFHEISMKALCEELGLDPCDDYAARIIAKPLASHRLPTRLKIGLDIGTQLDKTPCNICTNLQPFNPALETKPSTFRWSPILADQHKAPVWIMNSSPAIEYHCSATFTLTFFREKDEQSFVRTFTLPPHGFIVLVPDSDQELNDFLEGTIGWVTIVTSDAYSTVYYFARNPSGIVGGDHGF